MNTETRKEKRERIQREEIDNRVKNTWATIKSQTVKIHGKKVKVRQVVRSKANELPKMNTKEGSIDHYMNLKKAICIDGVDGFNNYIELVNKRIKELKQ